jgi:fibronectin type 3 domain-containing protein
LSNGVDNFVDSTAKTGTRYFYTVAAFDGSGDSLRSNQASATPGSVPLPATALTGVLGSNGLPSLSWARIGQATAYYIHRGIPASSAYTAWLVFSTSAADMSALHNQSYTYTVSAVDADGTGSPSNQVNLTTH